MTLNTMPHFSPSAGRHTTNSPFVVAERSYVPGEVMAILDCTRIAIVIGVPWGRHSYVLSRPRDGGQALREVSVMGRRHDVMSRCHESVCWCQ